MGFLRGIALVFICALLFMSFLLMGTFATLNLSLEYDVVKPQVNTIIREIVIDEVDRTVIEQQEIILKDYCNNNSEYVFEDANYTYIIPCDVIAQGTDAIIDKEVDSLINGTYYKEYDCKFWQCFKSEERPLFLVSQYAKDYWKSKYYNFLLISIVLAGLVFFLVEKKNNFPILVGVLLSISFIPVANLDTIGKAIVKIILSGAGLAIESLKSIDLNVIVSIFFSKANDVFLTGFIIGLILIGLGIFFKLLRVGFKIGKLFGKFRKTDSGTKQIETKVEEKVEKEEVKPETKKEKSSKKKEAK